MTDPKTKKTEEQPDLQIPEELPTLADGDGDGEGEGEDEEDDDSGSNPPGPGPVKPPGQP